MAEIVFLSPFGQGPSSLGHSLRSIEVGGGLLSTALILQGQDRIFHKSFLFLQFGVITPLQEMINPLEGFFPPPCLDFDPDSPVVGIFYSIVGSWPRVPNISIQEKGLPSFLFPDRKGSFVLITGYS